MQSRAMVGVQIFSSREINAENSQTVRKAGRVVYACPPLFVNAIAGKRAEMTEVSCLFYARFQSLRCVTVHLCRFRFPHEGWYPLSSR